MEHCHARQDTTNAGERFSFALCPVANTGVDFQVAQQGSGFDSQQVLDPNPHCARFHGGSSLEERPFGGTPLRREGGMHDGFARTKDEFAASQE